MDNIEQEIMNCFKEELKVEIVDVNESVFKSYGLHPRDVLYVLYKIMRNLNLVVLYIPYWNADTTSIKTLTDFLTRVKELNCVNNGQNSSD